jgi:hypothetical protein
VSRLPRAKGELGDRQQAAMDAVRADMERIAGDLQAVVGELGAAKAGSGALLEVVSLSEIVWKYRWHFVPEMVLAIGIDLFAVWALMMLALFGVELKDEKEAPTKFNGFLDLESLVGPQAAFDAVALTIEPPGLSEGGAGKAGADRKGKAGKQRKGS